MFSFIEDMVIVIGIGWIIGAFAAIPAAAALGSFAPAAIGGSLLSLGLAFFVLASKE